MVNVIVIVIVNVERNPDVVDIILKRLFPFVTILVHQFQPAACVLNADTAAAAVFVALGIVGIVADEHQLAIVLLQTDINRGGAIAAHSMLEGVLDERDEKQGGHFELTIDN